MARGLFRASCSLSECMSRRSARLVVPAAGAGVVTPGARTGEGATPPPESVVRPRRGFTKLMLSGGRGGLEVRKGGARGSGMGLFAGPQGIPAGGFVALHRGAWAWAWGSGGDYAGDSAYALLLDNWVLVTPVVSSRSLSGQFVAARANEPSPGGRGNVFALAWNGRGEVLQGECVDCLALHAGAEGVGPGQEILWHYGDLYRRKGYKVGEACVPLSASQCELPCRHFGHPSRVPLDAYRLR